jgi:hypothetical protein
MSKARVAFGLVFGAAALLAAMPRPAYAFKPDLEKCPLVKICKTVTPPCSSNPHPTRPCQAPYVKCTWVKKCPGD